MKRSALRPTVSLLFAAGLVLSTGGCMRTMTVASDNAAALGHDADGVPVLRSEKKKLTVAVRLMEEKFTGFTKTLPSLSVIVTNSTRNTLVLAPENISASSGDQPVPVLGISGLAAKILAEARALDAPIGFGKDASQPFEREVFYDAEGVAVPMPKIPKSPLEPDPPSMPNGAETQLRNVLGGETIVPGAIGGGIVKLDADAIRSGEPLKVRVTIGGETHDFLFKVK